MYRAHSLYFRRCEQNCEPKDEGWCPWLTDSQKRTDVLEGSEPFCLCFKSPFPSNPCRRASDIMRGRRKQKWRITEILALQLGLHEASENVLISYRPHCSYSRVCGKPSPATCQGVVLRFKRTFFWKKWDFNCKICFMDNFQTPPKRKGTLVSDSPCFIFNWLLELSNHAEFVSFHVINFQKVSRWGTVSKQNKFMRMGDESLELPIY